MKQYHYTTINVHWTTFDLIVSISLLTGLSKNEIILMILNRLSRDCRGKRPRHLRQVKYQENDPGNYTKMSLKLPLDAYEYFNDIRNIFRGSASLLIAIALRMYYDLFIDGKMDDAVFMHHSFVGFFFMGQQLWVKHWGEIPRNMDCKPRKIKYFYNYLPILD